MRPLLLGLAALTLVAGCSDDDGSGGDSLVPDRSGGAAALQIRPVLQVCIDIAAQPGATVDTTLTAASAVPSEATAFVPLAGTTQFCSVGPSQADGTVFDSDAEAIEVAGNGWSVQATFRPGFEGEDVWNALAAQCFQQAATCPTGQLAIVLDGVAMSVATVQVPEFRGSVQISGTFTEAEARELADLINAGAG